MFNGESGHVRIRHKIGNGLTADQQLLKNNPMSLGRINDPCARLVEPTLHTRNGLTQRKGMLKNTRVRTYSDKRTKNGLAQADRRGAGQLSVPPFTRYVMMRAELVFGIQEKIGIDEDHRKPSPSTCARSSWILSRFLPVLRPILRGLV